jgi:hypothetical protein
MSLRYSISDFFPFKEVLHEYVLSERREYKSCLQKYRLSWRKKQNSGEEQWVLFTMNSSIICSLTSAKRVGDTSLFLEDSSTSTRHFVHVETAFQEITVTYRHMHVGGGGSGDEDKWVEEVLHVCVPAHTLYGIAEVVTNLTNMIWAPSSSSSQEVKLKLD